LSLAADAVVVATGSSPCRLRLRDGTEAVTVHEVIAGKADGLRRAIVYDREGFNRPFVAADYLSARGVHVDFVTPLPVVGGLVEGMMLDEMVTQLTARGVRFHPGHELVARAGGDAIVLRDTATADERIIE